MGFFFTKKKANSNMGDKPYVPLYDTNTSIPKLYSRVKC